MNRTTAFVLGALLLACRTASAQTPLPVVQPATDVPAPLSLYVGEARVLNESDIRRIAVGNGKIVTTSIIGNHQLLLLAENEGQSTIHLWHRNGVENEYTVIVMSANAGRLMSEVKALLGEDSHVSTRVVGDKIILEGNDLGSEQTNRLEEISKRYPQIVNLISRVMLDKMVQIDVRIMEFRKSTLSQLGINWSTTGITGPTFGIVGDLARGSAFKPPGVGNGTGLANLGAIPNAAPAAAFSPYFGIQTSITSAIDAAVTKGDATFLSEPRLTVKSGGTAKFLSGGEVPIPTSSLFGQTSVQFKPYGVKLEVEPVVGDSGLIHLKAFTELSAIDPTVTVLGIPGFVTRRTDTEVNMQAEQTLVISGLFDGSDNRTLIKVPGIGDIPVLGELFRSRDFQKKKSDLVIFMTLHLVAADSPSNVEAVKEGAAQRAEALKKSKFEE